MEFIHSALEDAGCRILYEPDPTTAPYRFTFETPAGERLGILVYAFFANSQLTKNRPADEYRFQIAFKPGRKRLRSSWHDANSAYTTLVCGIDTEQKIFIAADPALHAPPDDMPTINYRESNVASVLAAGWAAWEFEQEERPIEILVGGRRQYFLSYVLFENAAVGLDAGLRHLLADEFSPMNWRMQEKI